MKIALFAPYFAPPGGGLPNYFEYWQKSAAANSGIDFFVPTNVDIKRYKKYDNVHFICMTAEEFWDRLQKLFDFQISHGYYKTAEYRVVFGILFKDILSGYDYWGTTDPDVIYGDILKFIKPYLDNGKEVIGTTAPFCLIKNTDRLRYLAFESAKGIDHPLNIKDSFSSDFCWHFDEVRGMGLRFYQAGIKAVPLNSVMADIDQKYKYFHIFGQSGKWGFWWKNGELIGYNNNKQQKEYMFAHFQKRRLALNGNENDADEFCIIPNIIINGSTDILPNIEPNTFAYTMCNRIKTYGKHKRQQKDIKKELIVSWLETDKYCRDNGLLPPKKKNIIIDLRDAFWGKAPY